MSAAEVPSHLLMEALDWVQQGRAEDALELVESLAEGRNGAQVAGYEELLRARLMEEYRERLPDAARLRRKLEGSELLSFNLPAGAGFLISMLDGETPVSDLVALSGMDPFDARRNLNRLIGAGIVELVS